MSNDISRTDQLLDPVLRAAMARIEEVFTAAAETEIGRLVDGAVTTAESIGRPLDAVAQSRAETATRGEVYGRLAVELDGIFDLFAGHLRERKAQEQHRFGDAVPRDMQTGVPLVAECPVCLAPAFRGAHAWLPHLVHEERLAGGYQPCGCTAGDEPCIRGRAHTGTCAYELADSDGELALVSIRCRPDDSTPHAA